MWRVLVASCISLGGVPADSTPCEADVVCGQRVLQNQERELLAAYDKVAQLQQQLGDLEQESEQKQTDLQDALSG